jgi:hypothetical protein
MWKKNLSLSKSLQSIILSLLLLVNIAHRVHIEVPGSENEVQIIEDLLGKFLLDDGGIYNSKKARRLSPKRKRVLGLADLEGENYV